MKYICIADYYSVGATVKIFSIGKIITEVKNTFSELNEGEFCKVNGNGVKYNGPDYKGYDNWIEVGIKVENYTLCPLTENEFNEHFIPLCKWRDMQIDEILK
jgi:hypothetical protein